MRGASWAFVPIFARAVARGFIFPPAYRSSDVGFRLTRQLWKEVGRIRGGSWFFEEVQAVVRKECACRVDLRDADVGVRLVRREGRDG